MTCQHSYNAVCLLSFNRFVTSSVVRIATRPGRPLPGRDLHPLDYRAFPRRTCTPTPTVISKDGPRITVLAYHLLHWVEYMLKLAGYDATWRRVRRILQTHCYATLIIPTKDAWEYRVCRPGRPDERQRFIYSKQDINTSLLPVKKQRFKKKM